MARSVRASVPPLIAQGVTLEPQVSVAFNPVYIYWKESSNAKRGPNRRPVDLSVATTARPPASWHRSPDVTGVCQTTR